MQRRRLEALAEAVQHVTEYKIPGSPLYLARNPGGIKAFPKWDNNGNQYWQPKDEHGNRVFNSVIDGLQSLMFDTALKLEGMSKHCLQPSDTLQEFAIAHGQPATAAEAYAKFLRRALQQDGINKKLTLSFFLEE